MSNAPPSYSRFHAIISATPASGLPPRPLPYPAPTHPHQPSAKRRRIDHPSPLSRALRDAAKNESTASRQRPSKFATKALLLEALKQSFKTSHSVDFHGSYELVDVDMTHKQRVQSLTVDIWRATGYRFTVKDHPRINNGHKTRFWCSQDEAHRSKSSKLARMPNSTSKPRISSAGEALAKARYPCKSRLLISSRDSTGGGGRVITVRMHHHVAHEPYVDTSLPPELAQAVYESFGWPTANSLGGSTTANSSTMLPPEALGFPQDDDDDDDDDDDEEEGEGDADADLEDDIDDGEDEDPLPIIAEPTLLVPPPPTSTSTLIPPPTSTPTIPLHRHSSIHSTTPPLPSIHNNRLTQLNGTTTTTTTQQQQQLYHQRMRAHISNIREFCSGLEYQLQFNDYRMLDVLEREGASFLKLVQECLKKEGRLDPAGEC